MMGIEHVIATRPALALAQLARAGARPQPLHLPPPFAELAALQLPVMRSEGQASVLNEYRLHGGRLDASLRDQVLNRDRITRSQLCRAWDTAAACRPRFADRRVLAVAQAMERLPAGGMVEA